MLQTASNLNYQPLPVRPVQSLNHGRTDFAKRSGTDLSVLFPQSVLRSSDSTGWQNVRAIHFCHTSREAVIPASDDHCIVKNLGEASFFMQVYPCKRRFEGKMLGGETAIIPAGSSWACRAEGAELPPMLLLYLRPLFVRSAASELNAGQSEIGLTPQIGFKDKNICHVAMSLLHELNEANVVGRLYADSLATGLAIQLMRRYSSLKDVQCWTRRHGATQLRQAIALIDHHLSDEEEGRVALRGGGARSAHELFSFFPSVQAVDGNDCDQLHSGTPDRACEADAGGDGIAKSLRLPCVRASPARATSQRRSPAGRRNTKSLSSSVINGQSNHSFHRITQKHLRNLWNGYQEENKARLLLRPHRAVLALAFLAVLGEAATDLLEPWPLKIVFDYVFGTKHMPSWMSDCLANFGLTKSAFFTSRFSP
jgi:hypothetical protein